MDDMHGVSACEICYEMYYIKEDQLKLLLKGLGQDMWYGLFSKAAQSSRSVQERNSAVNGMLADMYQNSVIDWEGAGIAVCQPYAAMIAAMLERKICVTIHMTGDESHVRCCYLSKEFVVLTRKSQREADTIGIAKISMPYWIRMLQEECHRLEDGESCSLIWRSSRDGQIHHSVHIQRDGIRTMKIEGNYGEDGCLYCAKEKLGEKLRELFYTEF